MSTIETVLPLGSAVSADGRESATGSTGRRCRTCFQRRFQAFRLVAMHFSSTLDLDRLRKLAITDYFDP